MMNFMNRLDQGAYTRILALGSSNTECSYRPDYAQGWLQWIDFTLRQLYGRCFMTLNSGSSGQTSTQLLERFEESAAFYQPHVIFITVGGNDSNPKKNVSLDLYLKNLNALFENVHKLKDCELIFQSYYAPVYPDLEETYASNFKSYMTAAIERARQSEAVHFDHFPAWEALQERMGMEAYRKELFDDAMHLNGKGNKLWAYQMLKRLVMPEHMAQAEKYFEDVKNFLH